MDLRPRCEIDGKVILNEERAKKCIVGIMERQPFPDDHLMQAYQGKCGHWHVGHGKKKEKKVYPPKPKNH